MQTLLQVSTRLRPTEEPRVPLGAPRSEIPRRFATVSTDCGGPSTRSTQQRDAQTKVDCFVRHTPTITAMRRLFRSQSPECMAAICQGGFSQIMAPTHIMAHAP